MSSHDCDSRVYYYLSPHVRGTNRVTVEQQIREQVRFQEIVVHLPATDPTLGIDPWTGEIDYSCRNTYLLKAVLNDIPIATIRVVVDAPEKTP